MLADKMLTDNKPQKLYDLLDMTSHVPLMTIFFCCLSIYKLNLRINHYTVIFALRCIQKISTRLYCKLHNHLLVSQQSVGIYLLDINNHSVCTPSARIQMSWYL